MMTIIMVLWTLFDGVGHCGNAITAQEFIQITITTMAVDLTMFICGFMTAGALKNEGRKA